MSGKSEWQNLLRTGMSHAFRSGEHVSICERISANDVALQVHTATDRKCQRCASGDGIPRIPCAAFFRSTVSPGAVVFIDEERVNEGDLLLSVDGMTFHTVVFKGYSRSANNLLAIDTLDPITGERGTITRIGDRLKWTWNDVKSPPAPASRKPKPRLKRGSLSFSKTGDSSFEGIIVPIPDERTSEYLFQADDGSIFYVDASKYQYSYESFRLFRGNLGGDPLRHVPITRVERYRDGGTTRMHTPEGVLFSPQQTSPTRAVPLWKNDEVKRLDLEKHSILQTGEQIIVVARRA